MPPKRSSSSRSHATPAPRARVEAGKRLAQSDFVTVELGARELLGGRPTWGGVTERLARYGLRRVVELLGRMSQLLVRFSDLEDRERVQVLILRELLGVRSVGVERRIKRFLDAQASRGRMPQWILFHQRQLVNVAKSAFLSLPVIAGKPEVEEEDLQPFFEALLMTSSLTDEGSAVVNGAGAQAEGGDRALEQYVFASLHSMPSGVEVHEIARGYLLYHTDRPHLYNRHKSYLNLPAKLEQITGIPSDTLWNILNAVTSHGGGALHGPSGPHCVLNPYRYLVDSGCCTRAEVTRFLDLYAIDAQRMKEDVYARYSFADMRPYSDLSFARRPMVMFGDCALVPSVPLLNAKLRQGTHHLFLDPDLVPDARERERYLTFLGHVFEDYVSDLLTRTYAGAIGTFVPGPVLESLVSGQVCDGLIHVGDTVVLVEAKARSFPLDAKEGRGWETYDAKLRGVFAGAARQLDSTARAIRAGRLKAIGVDPARIATYLPLIVTLEDSASNHLLYRHVMQMLSEQDVLQEPWMASLQIMDVGELENWETAVGIGRSMHRLLVSKASAPDTAPMTFSNYVVSRGVHLGNRKNPYLAATYDRLVERNITEFRARQDLAGTRHH